MMVGSCKDTGGSLVGVILVLPVGVECVAGGGFAFGSTSGSVGLKDLELVVVVVVDGTVVTCATFLTTGLVSWLLGGGLGEALGPPEVPLSLPSLGTAGQ